MPTKRGPNSPNWRGTNVSVKALRQRARNRYQKTYKMTLLKEVDLHHMDGNPFNNDVSNLMPLYHGDHSRLSWKLRRERTLG